MCVAVLLVSDCHIGRVTKNYDLGVFEDMMRNLKSNVLTVAERMDVERLAIFMLGDIVDGEEVYKGHAYEKETIVIEEVDIALWRFTDAITFWDKTIGIEGVWCVPGNHGRQRCGSVRSNWDAVFYRLLAERLANDVPITYTDEWYMIVELCGWRYMLTHGDCIRMYQQVPFYGIQRNVLRWASGVVPEFDVLCMGHFHICAKMSINDKVALLNGAMLRGDDYTERMGFKATNKFIMFGVDNIMPITWLSEIDLECEMW